MEDRSQGVREASGDAWRDDADDGDGSMPLLGLELTAVVNTGQYLTASEDSNPSPLLAPLLGTSTSEIVANARKSSPRRSPKRVCYAELLQDDGPSSPRTSQKTVLNGGRDAHLASNARWRTSISLKVRLRIASSSASTRWPLP